VPDAALPWALELFLERMDLWVDDAKPTADLVIVVATWIQSRMDDPFDGVERVEGFEDLWFGAVPASDDGIGNVVTCSYWIKVSTRTVRCDLFSTSTWPI
jgi:hypothetical protein